MGSIPEVPNSYDYQHSAFLRFLHASTVHLKSHVIESCPIAKSFARKLVRNMLNAPTKENGQELLPVQYRGDIVLRL